MCYHNSSRLSSSSSCAHNKQQVLHRNNNSSGNTPDKINLLSPMSSSSSSSVSSSVSSDSQFIKSKCTNCVLVQDIMSSSSSLSASSSPLHRVCLSCQKAEEDTTNTKDDSCKNNNDARKRSMSNSSSSNNNNKDSSHHFYSTTNTMDSSSLSHRLISCPCQSSKKNSSHHSSSSSVSQRRYKKNFGFFAATSSSSSYSSFSSSSFDSGWRPFLHLLFGLLLLLPLVPNTMSSPLRMQGASSSSASSSSSGDTGEHIRHQRPAKWINPCRLPTHPHGQSAHPGDFEVQQQSDADIFQNILIQVIKAEHQAKEFIRAFFTESFGPTPQYEQDKYKDLHYDWLENVAETVGKYLGEDVDPDKLAELNVGETLLALYEGLQKFAVGLEQVVLDQAVYGGSFHQNFHEAEFQLKYVLCELQIAMMEKNIVHQDITREIMSQQHRDLENKTTRDIRDWLIFRDYVNTLEYMRHTFKFFLSKTNKD